MKSFEEAIETCLSHINNYKKHCKKSNNDILSDREAFFKNLNPFGKQHGGRTGFQRADKFLTTLDTQIKSKKIKDTKQILDFAINYSDKGHLLSKYIWKSIREIAGFGEEHILYLIPIYQRTNAMVQGNWEEFEPSLKESRKCVEYYINNSILGNHPKLTQNFYFATDQNKDYGASLLKYLNTKIRKLELSDMKEVHEAKKTNTTKP